METNFFKKWRDLPSYTERDIDSIKAKVIKLVQSEVSTWTDFSESDIGLLYVEILSGLLDMANYYLDKQANECFLSTAQEVGSVINLSRSLGYNRPFRQSAVGKVVFAVSDFCDNDILIPKYTQVYSSDENKWFATTESAVINTVKDINKYVPYVEVPIIEGKVVTETTTTDTLKKDYKYYLSTNEIAEGSLQVQVNNWQFSNGNSFYTVCNDAFMQLNGGPYVSLHYSSDERAYLLFTWNNDEILPEDSHDVTITYVKSSGKYGSVPVYAIDTLVSVIRDSSGISKSNLIAVRNIEAVTGGADAPSMYQTKVNTINQIKSQDRYVTIEDYKDAVLSYPGVQDAIVMDWSTDNTSVTTPYEVQALIVLEDNQQITDTWLNRLTTAIKSKGICANEFSAAAADKVAITAVVDLTVTSADLESQAISKVIQAVLSNKGYGKMSFGETLSAETLRGIVINASSDVRAASVTLKVEGMVTDSSVIITPSLQQYPFVNDVQIGVVSYVER